jgi:hypothetical protein
MDKITIPRFLYDSLCKDSELVRHLAHYRGYGWIEAVKEEMESDKKYKQGAFKDSALQ